MLCSIFRYACPAIALLFVGGERTKDAKELIYARQKLVLVAKAFQLEAIDLVHIDYKGSSNCTVIELKQVIVKNYKFLAKNN